MTSEKLRDLSLNAKLLSVLKCLFQDKTQQKPFQFNNEL